jgi:hypothetical protein
LAAIDRSCRNCDKEHDDLHVRLDQTYPHRFGCARELLLSDGGWIELTRA